MRSTSDRPAASRRGCGPSARPRSHHRSQAQRPRRSHRPSRRAGHPPSVGDKMSAKYATAVALRAALDARLLDQARQQGRDPNWIRRRLAFTRILVRLTDQSSEAWILKGGMAVELRRPGLARSTKDLDLVLRPGLVADPADPVELHETIVEAVLKDSDGDGMGFEVARPSRLRDDAYGRPACLEVPGRVSTCRAPVRGVEDGCRGPIRGDRRCGATPVARCPGLCGHTYTIHLGH